MKMKLLRIRYTYLKLRSDKFSMAVLENVDKNVYTEKPIYPPIVDNSYKSRKLRERNTTHDKIMHIKTIEEKQIALNMPKYYGWKSIMFEENNIPYNAMPLVQCFTRSHFESVKTLPESYLECEPAAELLVKELRAQIEEVLVMENANVKREFTDIGGNKEAEQLEDARALVLVQQIHRIIMNHLVDRLPHLLTAQTDVRPRHEAFWFVGGVAPPPRVVNSRRSLSWYTYDVDEPVDRAVQYLGSPLLTLRSRDPLRPLLAAEPPGAAPPPLYDYQPGSSGYMTDHRHGTNIPGFWPGDEDQFGILSVHGRGHLLSRKPSFGAQDDLEALHCQAMKASFGWLLAQASYQGFTTFNDLTYPLATQTIITDGRLWSFYAYQLNTIALFGEKMSENQKFNVCFGTEPLKLYEAVENGKVIGFNDDVFKMLIQLYLNTPEPRDVELKPYLGKEERVIADIEEDGRRIWLENTYKRLVSNRPRHRLPPEIYNWEYIYKIYFKTRFQEPRRRPFEIGFNPFRRRLDEHQPAYIPKVLRPYPRHKKHWETTYYPKV